MPKPFLHLVSEKLLANHPEGLEHVCVVLPSRRAGLFLKRSLAALQVKPAISPLVVQIEELTSALAELHPMDSLSLQFELYHSYQKILGPEAETFEQFIKWSSRLLQDFNELDRYLVDVKAILENVTDAKALERWGVEGDTPELIESYIRFWKTLHPIYLDFTKKLSQEKKAYQGLMYRRAAERVSTENALKKWCEQVDCSTVYFVGFNALNEAEQVIFKNGLEEGIAKVWFDADVHYLEDPNQEAGLFLRSYKKWKHFEGVEFLFMRDLLRSEARTIEIIGVPKQIGMAKTLSEMLQKSKDELVEKEVEDHLALVLADEGLLLPVLNSIPKSFEDINVTMGLPLKELHLANSAEIILETQERAIRLKKDEGRSFQIYHKDIERLLIQPFYQYLLGNNDAHEVLSQMKKYNAPFLTLKKLGDWMPNCLLLNLLQEQPAQDVLIQLAHAFADYHDHGDALPEDLEAAQHLYKVTLRLKDLFESHGMETDMTTTLHLYRQLIREDSLDFFGEPLKGLQVMGVLETRLLSFDHLIMTSLNEGVLPAGRSENSFIPFDIKRAFGLPTHIEKDAIYAYHFYRLLQGTKHAIFLYNTESDSMNAGEASRFIEQIRHEFINFSNTTLIERVFSTSVHKDQIATPVELQRGPFLDEAFEKLAQRGVSPTSLKTWMENPMEFYTRYILGKDELDEVEEVLGDRTMGLVIHKLLEDFYTPFLGSRPSDEDYAKLLKEMNTLLKKYYRDEAKRELEVEGRNNLVGHAMFQMTRNFIQEERKRAAAYLKEGRNWIIQGKEKKMNFTIHVDGISYPILVKGTADRVDTLDGVWQVIDYKTGNVESSQLSASSVDVLVEDPKKAKALQLMTYAWLLSKTEPQAQSINAGIFAMRKNSEGMFKLKIDKVEEIKSSDLQTFEHVLSSLLYNIFSNEGVLLSVFEQDEVIEQTEGL